MNRETLDWAAGRGWVSPVACSLVQALSRAIAQGGAMPGRVLGACGDLISV